jgi:hypothetical protein
VVPDSGRPSKLRQIEFQNLRRAKSVSSPNNRNADVDKKRASSLRLAAKPCAAFAVWLERWEEFPTMAAFAMGDYSCDGVVARASRAMTRM